MIAWDDALEALRSRGYEIDRGLSDAEADAVEQGLGIRFPPDLRALLAAGLPRGEGFPDWRAEPAESLRARIEAPARGVLFDVEHNAAWLQEWGERPADPAEALRVAREHLAQAPPLIPVYAHRYIPAEPSEPGNPVFSVHQSDIVVYGADLAAYLAAEFGDAQPDSAPAPRHIRVWSDLVA